MLRRIGFPLLALVALLAILAPSPAQARSHVSFGISVGPAYPVYPYAYGYPYPYPYPYRSYYSGFYDPYYNPYVYSYPSYGYWGSSYYVRGHRDRDDFRGRGWGRGWRENNFRGGGRRHGR